MQTEANWLVPLYPAVRAALLDSVPSGWPDLGTLLCRLIPEPMIPEAALPLAACRAVGGDPTRAVSVSAALVAFGVGLRILDDLEDQDREGALWQDVGEARAWNYASAIHALAYKILCEAPLSGNERLEVNRMFASRSLRIACGQDQDLRRDKRSVDEYWRLVERKTSSAYELACGCGALAGTGVQEHIDACAAFGHHLGTAVQIFNDMESIWRADDSSPDPRQGKITLPVLYGLQFEHPARDELASIVSRNKMGVQHERIVEILDGIDARAFLVWAALKEREQALEALRACPGQDGQMALEAYFTGMFGDIDRFLDGEISMEP